ncbi:MAG: hypothetical protein WC533_02450 [Candidatus Pacearchaeota archaeon]
MLGQSRERPEYYKELEKWYEKLCQGAVGVYGNLCRASKRVNSVPEGARDSARDDWYHFYVKLAGILTFTEQDLFPEEFTDGRGYLKRIRDIGEKKDKIATRTRCNLPRLTRNEGEDIEQPLVGEFTRTKYALGPRLGEIYFFSKGCLFDETHRGLWNDFYNLANGYRMLETGNSESSRITTTTVEVPSRKSYNVIDKAIERWKYQKDWSK